jgi:hypothetical protein
VPARVKVVAVAEKPYAGENVGVAINSSDEPVTRTYASLADVRWHKYHVPAAAVEWKVTVLLSPVRVYSAVIDVDAEPPAEVQSPAVVHTTRWPLEPPSMLMRCSDPVMVRFGKKSKFEKRMSITAKSPSAEPPVLEVAKHTAREAAPVSEVSVEIANPDSTVFGNVRDDELTECAVEQSVLSSATKSPFCATPANCRVMPTPTKPATGEYVGLTDRKSLRLGMSVYTPFRGW